MSTLGLQKKAEAEPIFNPDANTAEVHGPEGVRYLQDKYLFNRAHRYIGLAPREQWLAPLTPEQEHNRRLQLQKNRKFFGSAKPNNAEAALPQQLIDAERENAKARAAESLAG
jgi:hypothetical protein